MITFDESIQTAIKCIEKWQYKDELKDITIIRDVTGRIAFLLDSEMPIDKVKISDLNIELKKVLGKHFQGNIYSKQNRNSDLVWAMIQEIERLRWEYNLEAEDGIKWYLLERAIAKKAWVECDNSQEPIWPYAEALEGRQPKVITFFSFKGGMGRTTALAATALTLAQEGKNVLMIDTDIEAPGLASLFFDEGSIRGGTVDYLLEAAVTSADENIRMNNMIMQVTDPVLMDEIEGKIFVICRVVDRNYLQKLARIDYQDAIPENMKKQLSRLIQDAANTVSGICQLDYVLLDSRAGFHDMGGVITAQSLMA